VFKRPLILLLVLFAGVCPATAGADERSKRPTITSAEIYVTNQALVGDISARNLFSDRIVGSVQSGLPAVVELLFKLVEGKNIAVNQGLIACELRYDVWDDRYTITWTDSVQEFPTFDAMSEAIENMKGVRIGLLEMTQTDRDHIVEFGLAVHPMRSKDKQDIEGFVSENVRGDTQERRQMLNLNELIEHFFSRNRDDATRSKRFRTATFQPGRLPVRETE
jgi:hypothetical protein